MNYFSICLIVVTFASGVLSASDSCQKDKAFDIALLSVQWAPGICANSDRKCVKYGNEFTIHGMWPNYADNSYPQFCCYQQYLNKGVLDPIRSKMDAHWRSLYDQDSWSFWIHEWKKHGTCAKFSALVGQFNYFNRTLDLFEELKLSSWLSESGIKPSESGVALETVREALRKGFTKRPQIACNGSGSGLPLMTEIRFCYDPESLKPVDCPAETKSCRSKTGKIVIIPAN
ncbi:uncharacterized protein LOC128394915 [Panonychus citri]|uniref:uncharacterized protein LOC128394915 n=1 Tax=Panonychus citri TaxID=50023 RepID=UPI0023076303|nr:uncharacterized protein LOC128394915 [Panonychus citri]